MRIFVTGGSGYIGRAAITALGRHGHEVTALVRGDRAAEVVSGLGAAPVTGTLHDLDTLRAAAAAADGAIHLAQDRAPETAAIDAAAAEAIQEGVGAGPYVHTGGAWVYGNTDGLVDEDAPQSAPPITAWRAANEKRVLDHAATGGRPVLLMPGVVYGHGGGLIEQFFTAPARERHAVRVIGTGANHWGLVHVDDIAELYALALGAPAGSVYAGVTTSDYTLAQVAEAAGRAAGCPGRIEPVTIDQARKVMGPIADAFALDQQISSARARTQLGWNPPSRNVLAEIEQGR
ncbi:MAG TPA: NAD-dependent epimerase/dehydratase family protein [Trebonia sp.]|jgi:nucleoside-diphosphate-sugar epimerase|nr:NAD-dependent epimerase/dehydratase family protein [Trebonia sp.]